MTSFVHTCNMQAKNIIEKIFHCGHWYVRYCSFSQRINDGLLILSARRTAKLILKDTMVFNNTVCLISIWNIFCLFPFITMVV